MKLFLRLKISYQNSIDLRVRTDMGSEFKSAAAESLFRELKVKNFYAKNTETKASIIERFFKTLKTLIFRFMVSKNTHRWVDGIFNIVKTYNLSFHKSIKQSPASVKEVDEYKIWKELYYKKNSIHSELNFKFKFNIHDTVRISNIKAPFERNFDEKWTREYFIISDRFYKENVPVYVLKDIQNDAVEGVFYNNELQKIDVSDSDDTYIIDKILKKSKGKSLILWLGWPKKFATWLRNTEIQNLQLK